MAKKKKGPTPPPAPVRRKPPRPAAAVPAKPSVRSVVSREGFKRKLIAGGLAAAALTAVVGYVIGDRRADAELREALTAGSCEVDTEADEKTTSSGHVSNPTYTVDPPAGGDHNPGAAKGGVYEGPRVPEDGLLVHSMEHGYVVVWHQPGLPEVQKAQLEVFEQRNRGDVIVAERPNLAEPVAATAWGQRLLCEKVELEALDRFAEEYVGKGPEDVPRG